MGMSLLRYAVGDGLGMESLCVANRPSCWSCSLSRYTDMEEPAGSREFFIVKSPRN